MENLGKVIVIIGIILVVIGLGVWFFADKLGWFGQLPGDVRIEGENVQFYAPITSMIILSIVLSIILSIISRVLR